ncbi:MAG TPA: DinB family protein [Vicinamibacterales bacterium]|jgi:uncharacterized damage-inducible protein DinB
MTPEQALTILNAVAVPSLTNEQPLTRRVIEAILPDKGDYKPDPFSRPALELAWHIVSAENRFIEAACDGAFDLSPRPMPATVKTPSDVAAWYDHEFAKNIARAKGLSGEQLTKIIDFRGIFRLPAVIFLNIGLNHSIHHRGQLSTYLRPMGSKVPSIYGESYDARIAREAATKS